MKKLQTLKPDWNTLLLTLYMAVIWAAYLCLYHYGEWSVINPPAVLTVCTAIAFFGLVYFFCYWIMKLIRWLLEIRQEACDRKKFVQAYIFFFLCSLIILSIWYLAYLPGAYSPDTLNQINQVLTGHYVDWHPVWHTWLFIGIPHWITGTLTFFTPFQILFYSAVFGYFGAFLYRYAGFRFALLSAVYILLNPFTCRMTMYPWKDIPFSMTALLATLLVLNIYFRRDKEVKTGQAAVIGILLGNASLFRINGILFTAVLALACIFLMNRKQWLIMMAAFLGFVLVIKGPVYALAGVERPESHKVDHLGLPMTVIANVVKEHPEVLDEETKDLVYSMADQETWEELYQCGDFNTIRYQINTDPLDERSTMQTLGIMFRCLKAAPADGMRALFTLTQLVYGVEGEQRGDYNPWLRWNDYGLVYSGNYELQQILDIYYRTYYETIFRYTRYIGTALAVMLAFMLGRSRLNSRSDWKRILLCLPIFVHDYGTMLLLTGDDLRFFYLTYLLCPVIILLMLRKNEFADRKQES